MAALTGKCLRSNGLPIQGVTNGHLDRKLFFDISLIIDVVSLGIPYAAIVAAKGKAFVTLDIFDV